MPDPSLQVGGLALSSADRVLGPLGFTLPHSGCWWLTGVSGAGKSLLLESLAGFHLESQGSIRVGTREVGDLAPEHRSITLMPQRSRLFPHWTVARNLRFAAKLSGSTTDRTAALALRLHVANLLDRPARALSGGETQRIALIQTLLAHAPILLLDEPLSAIDAALQSVVLDLILEESTQHRRIFLIASHRPAADYPMQGELCLKNGQMLSSTRTVLTVSNTFR